MKGSTGIDVRFFKWKMTLTDGVRMVGMGESWHHFAVDLQRLSKKSKLGLYHSDYCWT